MGGLLVLAGGRWDLVLREGFWRRLGVCWKRMQWRLRHLVRLLVQRGFRVGLSLR